MKSLTGLIGSMSVALTLLFGTSSLAAPTSINCDQLKTAIDNTDTFLDANNVSFPNLGKLVSTSLLDPTTGGTLVGLINAYYGSPVFTSPTGVLTATGKCGLIPFLIQQIND